MRPSVIRHNTRYVFKQPAAGDMCQGVNVHVVKQLQQGFDVNGSGRQQGASQGLAMKIGRQVSLAVFDNLSNQLIPV